MLSAEGYPKKRGALAKVALTLNIPERTISRWFNGEQNVVSDQIVMKKEFDLSAALRRELEQIIPLLEERRKEATYPQLMTAIGILTDKTLLLDGKITSRDEIIIRIERD